MSSFTLTAVDRFPEGTTVGAYPSSAWAFRDLPPYGAPPGPPVESQIMGANSVTFNTLNDGNYYFGAQVDGVWRFVQGTVGGSGGGSVGSGSGGAILPGDLQGAPDPADGQILAWASAGGGAFVPVDRLRTKNEGTPLAHRPYVDFTGAGVEATDEGDRIKVDIPGTAATLYNQTIEDEGTPLPQRSVVKVTGAGVTAADVGGKTVIDIPGTAPAGGYNQIKGNGLDVAQRTVLDFAGARVAVADVGGAKTVVTILDPADVFLKPPFAGAQAASNTPLDSAAKRLMYRWVARKTGSVTKLHHSAVTGSAGYFGGTTGTWEATTYAVDPTTGLPTGAAIRQETGIVPSARVASGVGYVDMTKNGGATPGALAVTKGDEYATVFRNTDAAPGTNWASLNNFWHEDDTSLTRGIYGAQARNERSAAAADAYYGLDPREVLGKSLDSGATWLIPCSGYNAALSYKEIPALTQEYSDGTAYGQPYYSSTRSALTDGALYTVRYNIRRDQTFTFIGAFIQGYSPYHTPNGYNSGSTQVELEVNGKPQGVAFLSGHGFVRGQLGRPISVVNGDVVKLRFRYHSTGQRGIAVTAPYFDTPLNTVLGEAGARPGSAYEWSVEELAGNYIIPVWPLPYLKKTD